MAPPTKESAEQTLERIAEMCMEALDPCLSRETLARCVKDIWILADSCSDDALGGDNDEIE